jgi:hypothetical protein
MAASPQLLESAPLEGLTTTEATEAAPAEGKAAAALFQRNAIDTNAISIVLTWSLCLWTADLVEWSFILGHFVIHQPWFLSSNV